MMCDEPYHDDDYPNKREIPSKREIRIQHQLNCPFPEFGICGCFNLAASEASAISPTTYKEAHTEAMRKLRAAKVAIGRALDLLEES